MEQYPEGVAREVKYCPVLELVFLTLSLGTEARSKNSRSPKLTSSTVKLEKSGRSKLEKASWLMGPGSGSLKRMLSSAGRRASKDSSTSEFKLISKHFKTNYDRQYLIAS